MINQLIIDLLISVWLCIILNMYTVNHKTKIRWMEPMTERTLDNQYVKFNSFIEYSTDCYCEIVEALQISFLLLLINDKQKVNFLLSYYKTYFFFFI